MDMYLLRLLYLRNKKQVCLRYGWRNGQIDKDPYAGISSLTIGIFGDYRHYHG
jgi:hypothetical protein